MDVPQAHLDVPDHYETLGVLDVKLWKPSMSKLVAFSGSLVVV